MSEIPKEAGPCELTALRARVKELEERLADQVSLTDAFRISEANFDEACDKLKARIRELEEAMPDPIKIREIGKAGTCGTGYMKYWTDACEIASRINAVMRKEGNE